MAGQPQASPPFGPDKPRPPATSAATDGSHPSPGKKANTRGVAGGQLRGAHYETGTSSRRKAESQEEPGRHRCKATPSSKAGRLKSAPGRGPRTSPLPKQGGEEEARGGPGPDEDAEWTPSSQESGQATLSDVTPDRGQGHVTPDRGQGHVTPDRGQAHGPRCCKTISRASSRRSQAESAQSKHAERGAGSGTDSENEDAARKRNSDFDLAAVDISDEKAWDTDLEMEDAPTPFDHSGKTTYLEECRRVGAIPVSYFLRHMHDKQLDMKHHGLAASGMKPIATVLMSNTTILTLDLADNWLGFQGGLAICEMLKENCFITELNLSDNRLNKCAWDLCKILAVNDTLRKVVLSGNGFDDRAAEYFADLLTSPTRVEILDLSHNNLCEAAGMLLGPAISDNASIKDLDLSWNHLRRKGAMAIAAGVKSNVYMKKLNLAWNGLGLEGAIALGDALKGNAVLEELNIMNNRITTEGAVLIGKGLTVNETLKVLQMGKNPMQSAGCWGICAAILKNPNCVLTDLDFADILVNKDFEELFQQVREKLPTLKVRHGGMEAPLKPKAKMHPMLKLMTYIDKHNLRLVDFFNKFDKDGSMSVTHDEFKEGLMETGIQMSEEDVHLLLQELDRDGDGEINYSELVIGHTDFQEQEKKNQQSMSTVRPMTS